MRVLTKSDTPAVLISSATAWTAEYLESLRTGRPTTPWRHSDVVGALGGETFGKCAYCEAIIADVSYPHVEHMCPKSVRPDLVVKWDNLTIACTRCNTEKV
jgi:uncharacterized protein (TIGR02646 family)